MLLADPGKKVIRNFVDALTKFDLIKNERKKTSLEWGR
jgi:hypothetical protein